MKTRKQKPDESELTATIRKVLREEIQRVAVSLARVPQGNNKAEASRKLSVSTPTINRMLKDGRINGLKSDGRWFISDREIDRFLEG